MKPQRHCRLIPRARRCRPERLFILGQSLGGTNAIAVVGAGKRTGLLTVEGGVHIDAFTPRWGGRYEQALLDFFEGAPAGR